MVSTRQQCSSSSTSSSSSSVSTTKAAVVITKPEKCLAVVSLGQSSSSPTSQVGLLDIPYEIQEKIFSYTNFKHISQLRAVCI